MPAGVLVTVPAPVPALATVRACLVSIKVAVTFWTWVMVTEQAPVPVQAPLQPANVEPAPAVAVNATDEEEGKLDEQVAPQLIPDGALVTLPRVAALPDLVTVNEYWVPTWNVAVTALAALIATTQLVDPVHAPLQPAK